MKTLILTTALVLVSIVNVLAQEARPGQPIKGVIVKGGSNPGPKAANLDVADQSFSGHESFDDAAMARPGQPIGGIVVKGGQNPRPKGNYFVTIDPASGEEVEVSTEEAAFVAGNPIGGIIVKGGHNGVQAIETNPLYTGSGTSGVNPLHKD